MPVLTLPQPPAPSASPASPPFIHYEYIDGPPGRPCLVFLHEGLGCVAMWRDFPALLCQATACAGLVYDRQGYGASSPLTARRGIHYLHDYALQELPLVLAHVLAPGTDYFLIGHSDGGSIALIHAAGQPPRLRGIVTEAAHVFVEPQTLAGIRAADAAYDAGKLRGLQKYHGEQTQTIFKAWSETWQAPGFHAWNIEYLLPSIYCPVLVVQGSDDQYGSPAQVEAITGQALNATPVLVENCGHAPHQEQPQALLALMANFLQGQMALAK